MSKIYTKKFVSFLLCILVFISTFAFAVINTDAATTNTLLTTTTLNLRKEKSTDSDVLTVIPKGATLTLLSNSTDGWAEVSYSSYKGYCSTAYLEPASGSTVKITGKTTSYVNMRTEKSTDSDVIMVVPDEAIVTVNDNTDSKWANIIFHNNIGYVSKDYLIVMFTLSEQTDIPVDEFKYPSPDMSGLPLWSTQSLTDKMIEKQSKEDNSLVLNVSAVNLDINETFSIIAYKSGTTPVSHNVTYSSSDSKIASVSADGLITAKSKGSVNITATDKITSEKVVCKVTVSGKTVEPKPTEPPIQPTEPPTQPPTQPPVTGDFTLSDKEITLYVGNEYILKTNTSSTLTWTTSDSSVVTVSEGMVVAKGEGTATVTAKTSKSSASCAVTVKKSETSVAISHGSASVTSGKTFLASSATSGVTWTSSDTSVATVNNGYILGVSPGKAIVKVEKEGGASTMIVTVTDSAPIRFAYTSPNCAQKNCTVNLVAITDKTRSEVKFDVTVGSDTKTVNATSKTADGNNYLWKGTITFDKAGTYNVKAYSKKNSSSSWQTCADASTTAFVTSTTDKNTTMCEKRRASDEIISLIANYEGFVGSVYADPLTGDPTLGYGRVVYSGQQFYNNLTKTEAYAYLVQTVNNDGYSSKVNSFLVNNNVKFNQQQYDALVCFVYNTGTGVLTNDDDIKYALLNCNSGNEGDVTYFVNGSNVRIRKGPSTSDEIIRELSYGTELTLLEKTSDSWYYVKLSDGTEGYVASDYVQMRVSSGDLDLNFVDRQDVIDNFCQYHHAGGCIYGLLYRRVDEMEVFFYNEYTRNYGTYKFDIKFTCANNENFHT